MFEGSNGCDVPYGLALKNQEQAAYAMANTISARLSRAVEQAEVQLADARRAKEIFDRHPELEELLNIMQKGRF